MGRRSRLCIARVASIQKIPFIEVFKIAEGLELIPHSCKRRMSPQGEKMCFTGVALRNVSFPSSLFRTVPVHRGFSALGSSDVAQTLMPGEKLFRGIRQLKKSKTKYITLQGHSQEVYVLSWASFEYLPYFSAPKSQHIPQQAASLRKPPLAHLGWLRCYSASAYLLLPLPYPFRKRNSIEGLPSQIKKAAKITRFPP